jgi:hypothetical protein
VAGSLSPEDYDLFALPYQKMVVKAIKDKAQKKILKRTLFVMHFHKKYTRVLTFQNFCPKTKTRTPTPLSSSTSPSLAPWSSAVTNSQKSAK